MVSYPLELGNRVVKYLRTFLFFAGLIPFTIVAGVLAAPALLSKKATWCVADIWVGFTLHWLRLTCGITSHTKGAQGLPFHQVIYASKHQSAWDTLMLWRTLPRPLFILKRELYLIPFFGWYLWRSDQIAINRADRRKAMEQIVAQAGQAKKSNRPIVIFPEGTRGKPDAPTTYHSGVAKLSAALGWPVIPVALNAGKFWPKRPLWKTPGAATMEFLPPMHVCGDDKAAWMQELKERIDLASRAL
jgi:1-acyl-sn-glycerol-3-phosphate acyltransferase